jgi:hypothetical protein
MSDYAITPEPEPEDQGEALNRTASAVAPAPSEMSQRTGLARLMKPRLEATGTMNLSTVSDTGSAFGLTSSRPSEMIPDHNENDRARARRTELTATSRKLGLAPTEMDLDTVASGLGRSASKPRSMSDSTTMSSHTGTMPIRTDAEPAHLPLEDATRSTSAATGNMGPPRSVPERGTSETSAEPEGWAKRAARTGVPEPSKVPAYNVG